MIVICSDGNGEIGSSWFIIFKPHRKWKSQKGMYIRPIVNCQLTTQFYSDRSFEEEEIKGQLRIKPRTWSNKPATMSHTVDGSANSDRACTLQL